ncbi:MULTISPECIES: phosphoribosylglycinamide formyltransferase [Methylobacterium]|uniref:Phosphoribosylglycinamide formyltransferase n=1 Tax=Methylobacterium jeotgali TaxID=381630 RepID=A0ABQ4T1M4_9HYPH|nr:MULTISPECIES: phosphoribosylglycinamide formyltransferase [Methylobacterium]PIU08371.1 MAG: phosphoribosylglycinamide formyltransferase [Methylobacterium sp. CG09_land_8_20_14_0_10_71_15]PIU13552.1 MAG: phosphoribosylglycinamide formyltransferase [Methylobacterium sp. CG08_land_8_20_14_0_20_71_15]GBU18717.1 phosphoribosylglycinamide formyltransferase 1 [Methylobacterium sp.]GJE07776.1 Phosphoribosylglycinamide formyltransferase [Methylobacterium jeotgali]
MSRTRTAVLISGRGSNMTVLVEAAKAADYPAEIALVLSNRPEAAGLAYAAGQRIPTLALDHRAYPDRGSFDAALDGALREAGIELVVLAGFMRILTPGFVEAWAGRMINIHPSLLPLFRGTHTHEQALAAGVRVHGCSVHYVVPELDAGPIVAQAAVPVLPGDDADALAARVLVQEHRLYPAALAMIASGRARLEGGRVILAEAARDAGGALLSL